MTQSNTVDVQTTPNGSLNVKAMNQAIGLIQKMKRKEELDKGWRIRDQYRFVIDPGHTPVMNATV